MLIRGVIRWSNLYGPVTIVTSPGHTEQEFPKIQTPERSGIISRLSTPGVLKARKDLGIPIVTIEPSVETLNVQKEKLEISEILSNSPKIAQWGAEHFLSRGFRHFAFCGLPLRYWSDIREREFQRIITSQELNCFIYPFPDPSGLLSRKEEYPFLAAWLNSLPKPVAVMTCNDDRGSQIIEICNQTGYPVPEQVAVLGVDNDDLICELSQPPLSSIALDLEKAGFHAAELLWNLISHQTSGYHCIPLEPTKIVTRLSSDMTEQGDELIHQAIRFIRENYQSPIGVSNVARELDISRRTLERRFTAVLNRSVREQIQLFRLEQAKDLLIFTNDTIEQIAELTGFGNPKSMIRAFNQLEKMTPSQFRKLNSVADKITK
jgi:LacI family transcriptional regulator